ncbi:hypothetical protein PENSPDRAFT_660095 [Peniophora sp. CONT]|nr:hypothetical protein PENSPDRAFT_660095 [Peniophora sp. CONT]
MSEHRTAAYPLRLHPYSCYGPSHRPTLVPDRYGVALTASHTATVFRQSAPARNKCFKRVAHWSLPPYTRPDPSVKIYPAACNGIYRIFPSLASASTYVGAILSTIVKDPAQGPQPPRALSCRMLSQSSGRSVRDRMPQLHKPHFSVPDGLSYFYPIDRVGKALARDIPGAGKVPIRVASDKCEQWRS